MEIKSKKMLVTGGAGFIGGHLVQELVEMGALVTVIDIVVNPKSIYFLNGLKKKTKYVALDIRDKKKVEHFFSAYTPDYIFHLAADPIVEDAYNNPYRTFETNIMGTVHILEEVRKNKSIKGIIVASSDKAYGKTTKTYTEESPLQGDHPYDVSKSSADLISSAYASTYKLPIVVTRFGNVYGEGDLHFSRIIPGMCSAIVRKTPLLIRSDGTYVRDYLYIKDVVDGYITLLLNLEKIKGEAFNFSSKDTFSVLELIRQAEKIIKTKIPYRIVNNAKNEIPYQHLNDDKIRKLGWVNNSSLYDKISDIVEWYKKVL